MKMKEESEKVGLKLNLQKTKIMASGPITSWQIDGETMETMRDYSSVQFSRSVVSNVLELQGLQDPRVPCPSPTPGAYSNLCPLSRWCHPTILPIRWPKYWSFSFIISPSNEYSGLISFRMDWLDLLTVQGTLKSLLQHHSSKALILQHSAFFMV